MEITSLRVLTHPVGAWFSRGLSRGGGEGGHEGGGGHEGEEKKKESKNKKKYKKAIKSHRPYLSSDSLKTRLYDPAPCVSISVGDPLCSDPLDSGVERKTWQLARSAKLFRQSYALRLELKECGEGFCWSGNRFCGRWERCVCRRAKLSSVCSWGRGDTMQLRQEVILCSWGRRWYYVVEAGGDTL